jgi:hypothetical protein
MDLFLLAPKTLSFRRSTHGFEVDFLIGSMTAVAVKSSGRVTQRDFRGLNALHEEGIFTEFILVSQDPVQTRDGSFRAMHWRTFLEGLWVGEFC